MYGDRDRDTLTTSEYGIEVCILCNISFCTAGGRSGCQVSFRLTAVATLGYMTHGDRCIGVNGEVVPPSLVTVQAVWWLVSACVHILGESAISLC